MVDDSLIDVSENEIVEKRGKNMDDLEEKKIRLLYDE